MSGTCPIKISKSTIDDLEKKFGKDLNKMIDDLTPLTESCPMKSSSGGKRRKTKGSRRKYQKGGDLISALTFKRIINALIVVLMAYMTMTGNAGMTGVVTGVIAVLQGECGSMSNYFWEAIGLGNPICLTYNRLMLTIMKAISLDGMALAQLGSILTIVLAAPYTLLAGSRIVTYQIARLVPEQILSSQELNMLRNEAVGGRAQIESQATPEQMTQIAAIFDDGSSQNQIENSDTTSNNNDEDYDENDAAATLMSMGNATGGKRRKRKSMTKRKTMTKRKRKNSGKKGKKGKKSRRYKR